MPNRILRDWTDSFIMDNLDSNEERFFVRLIMKVDDYGCFHADTRLLRANLFPLKTDIRDADISRWITACEKAGLITIYNVAKKEFLQITNFKQALRQKTKKFPLPNECIADDTHTHSNSISIASLKRSRNEVETETRVDAREDENQALEKPNIAQSNLFRKPRIPKFQEVHEVFVRNGGTEAMAKSFFDRNEATGWFFKGSPITNYVSMVGSFISNWERNERSNPESMKPKISTQMREL